jgi:hypothetical protein
MGPRWSERLPSEKSDRWCSLVNANHYDRSNHGGLPGRWAFYARQGHGWRWCSVSVAECKAACVKQGECAEVYYAQNGCCFPSKKRCVGEFRPGGQGPHSGKYVLDRPAEPPPPPRAEDAPEAAAATAQAAPAAAGAPNMSLVLALLLLVALLLAFAVPLRGVIRRWRGKGKGHDYARLPLRDPTAAGGAAGTRRRAAASMPVFDYTTGRFV